ncbi:hypothetical protein F5B21DRAFT_528893 [Xylaria acuta]|nr:hypothetical protein F5B21DRAFT_528893 [Xylaria acuta]
MEPFQRSLSHGLVREGEDPEPQSNIRLKGYLTVRINQVPLNMIRESFENDLKSIDIPDSVLHEAGDSGRTPLWVAARQGQEAIVWLLIDIGKVDISVKDKRFGLTPVRVAAQKNHEAVSRLLRGSGHVDEDQLTLYEEYDTDKDYDSDES